MRTRQTKLAEEAAESDRKLESNGSGEEATNVNVIPEELTPDALKDLPQNRNGYETQETSKNDTVSLGHLNLDSDSISAADVVSKTDYEIPADAPIQKEEATHTSVVGSCEGTTVDDSISDGISIATVETENDASGSVRTEGGTSSNSSIEFRLEEGSTSHTLPVAEGASDSTKLEEGTSSVASSTVECDTYKMELISNESTAKPSICSPEKSTVVEKMPVDAQILDELPKDSIHSEESASSIMLTTDRNTTNVGETSIGSEGTPKPTTVGKVCDLTKSEGIPKSLEEGLDEKKPRPKLLIKTTAEFVKIGRKFCVERNIGFPNKRNLRNIVYDLRKVKKLDEKHLKIALEAAAQRKRDSSSTPQGKTDGGDQWGPSESPAKLLVDSKFESRQRNREEVNSRYKEFRLIARQYCEVNHCYPPNKKIFKPLLFDLLQKKQLDEKNLKIALDKHIKSKNSRVESDRFKQVGCKAQRNPAVAIVEAKKGKILRSVVKPLSELTTGERITFFEEFRTLQIKLKPIAIKHCHTIKSPFPNYKEFFWICRDLFEAGMLDEENVKLSIEKAFEERCKRPLIDERLHFILKHYCADNGIHDYSMTRMKNEILSKIPQTLLTQKQYWALMYKDRKTNLFTDDNLAHPETARLLKEDLKLNNSQLAASCQQNHVSSIVQENDTTIGCDVKPTKPAASCQQNHASSIVQENDTTISCDVKPRLRLSGAARRKLRRSNLRSDSPQNGKLHAMGLPWSNTNQKRGRENQQGNSEATSSSYTNPRLIKFSQGLNEEPIQQLLVQAKQWIAEKAQMLGGLDSQDRNVSQPNSWGRNNFGQPKNIESRKLPYWGKKQAQWGEGRDKAQPSSSNSFGICDKSQPQTWGQGAMNVHDQTNLLGPPIIRPSPQFIPSISTLVASVGSYFPEPNFTAQNLMITNVRVPGRTSSQPTWPLRSENRSFGRTDIPNDDYSWNSDLGEQPRNHRAVFGRTLGSDPLEGTSEQRCSERERFNPPRRNMTDLDKPSSPNQQDQSREKIRDNDWRFARDAPHDKDWRFTRDAPPQKKSRFDEDRQPETSLSSLLECAMNDVDDWTTKNTKPSSEHMNPSTSSRKNWDRASPPRALMSETSEMPTVNNNPPFVEPGKTCKVAIVHEDYPRRKLTDQEADLIRSALLDRIGRQSGIAPRFIDTYDELGAVIFECEDQLTVSWFWLNASTITPWRSSKLRTISWEKPLNEISIDVPKLLQSLTPLALCKKLMSQNPGLSTGHWTLKSADVTSTKGLNLVFNIDDESMKKLKSLDLRPYLGFSRVKIHINQE